VPMKMNWKSYAIKKKLINSFKLLHVYCPNQYLNNIYLNFIIYEKELIILNYMPIKINGNHDDVRVYLILFKNKLIDW